MTMTDPIADMLTRIRNANTAMHDTVKMPSSKLKVSLADILQREGYIAGFDVGPAEARPGDVLEIRLKYTSDRVRTIGGLKRVSRPGLRIYAARRWHAPRARGNGCRRGVHQPRSHDRSRSPPEAGRRGGPLLCVVSACGARRWPRVSRRACPHRGTRTA